MNEPASQVTHERFGHDACCIVPVESHKYPNSQMDGFVDDDGNIPISTRIFYLYIYYKVVMVLGSYGPFDAAAGWGTRSLAEFTDLRRILSVPPERLEPPRRAGRITSCVCSENEVCHAHGSRLWELSRVL